MAAELDFDNAQHLARALKSIKGFPWDEDTINATAGDLVRWCKGGIINGRLWTPEEQAGAIVDEAREAWEEWQGSRQLKLLFLEKFTPAVEEKPPASSAELVQRGLLAPRCIHCEPGAEFCEYGGAKQHARAAVEIAAAQAHWKTHDLPIRPPTKPAARPTSIEELRRQVEAMERARKEREHRTA